jgi:hypothetical protein
MQKAAYRAASVAWPIRLMDLAMILPSRHATAATVHINLKIESESASEGPLSSKTDNICLF